MEHKVKSKLKHMFHRFKRTKKGRKFDEDHGLYMHQYDNFRLQSGNSPFSNDTLPAIPRQTISDLARIVDTKMHDFLHEQRADDGTERPGFLGLLGEIDCGNAIRMSQIFHSISLDSSELPPRLHSKFNLSSTANPALSSESNHLDVTAFPQPPKTLSNGESSDLSYSAGDVEQAEAAPSQLFDSIDTTEHIPATVPRPSIKEQKGRITPKPANAAKTLLYKEKTRSRLDTTVKKMSSLRHQLVPEEIPVVVPMLQEEDSWDCSVMDYYGISGTQSHQVGYSSIEESMISIDESNFI